MDPKTIVCDVCAETFFSKTNFQNHYQKEHEDSYKCLNCDKELVNKKALYQHQQDAHMHSLKCECCDKVLALEKDSHGSQLLKCD